MNDEARSPRYSVVVPVYQSHDSLLELVERLRAVFEETLAATYEILLIDDGSDVPQTWSTCEELARRYPAVSAIRLMRNYGKPAAVLCGLRHARGRWIITIDDDLQQRPEDIPALVRHESHDVVVAEFDVRRHSLLIRWTSWAKGHFDSLILRLPCKMSPLKLFKAEVARGMLRVRTPYPFIPALMAHTTRDFVTVSVPHRPSRHGRSRYTLRRRIEQFSNLLISNSSVLLRWLGGIGFVAAICGVAYGLAVLVRRLVSSAPILPGWTSLVVISVVFPSLILMALGIMGEYLIRLLAGISQRPAYLVRSSIGLPEPPGPGRTAAGAGPDQPVGEVTGDEYPGAE